VFVYVLIVVILTYHSWVEPHSITGSPGQHPGAFRLHVPHLCCCWILWRPKYICLHGCWGTVYDFSNSYQWLCV